VWVNRIVSNGIIHFSFVTVCMLHSFVSIKMFNNYNLLDLMATDYGNYARNILRIFFSQDELKSSILPPGKPHLRRQPLDQDRFKICVWVCKFF